MNTATLFRDCNKSSLFLKRKKSVNPDTPFLTQDLKIMKPKIVTSKEITQSLLNRK